MREKERRKLRQMNDEEYFTRPEVGRLLTGFLRNMTKKRLTVTLQCGIEQVAYTTGTKTVIDVLNRLTQAYVLRSDKLLTLIGLVGHEAGHILFSDFEALRLYLEGLVSGMFHGGDPVVEPKYSDYLTEMKQYYADRAAVTGSVLRRVGKRVLNIVDDGFVNILIILTFPGNVARGLKMVITKTVEEYPPAEDLLAEDPLSGLIGIIHQYVLCGAYQGNAGPYQDVVENLVLRAEAVLRGSSAMERVSAATEILVMLWPYLKTVIDETQEPEETEDNESIKTMEKRFEGTQADMPDIDVSQLPDLNGDDDIQASGDDDLMGSLDELIGKNMAREDRDKGLREEHDAMNMTAEDNIPVSINTLPDIPDDADQKVQQLHSKLNGHIRRMLQTTRHLFEEKEGGVLDGQICGGRIGSKLYRRDQKIFIKNLMPGPEISVAVGILVDESGSMASCDERNLKAAREMAFMAYQFCRRLDIPVSVIGHGVGYRALHLDVITDFEVSPDDERCIATIGSHVSNYDAYAIEYIGRRLLGRTEDIRLLFVISDGAPSYPYSKSEQERIEAIRNIVSMLRKHGIIVIATALDMEFETVREIYEKDCMNISDMSRVPALFPRLIAKYIQ